MHELEKEQVVNEPRLVAVSRRALLARGALAGALLALPGLACAANDAEVFAAASTVSAAPSTTGSVTTATTAAGAAVTAGTVASTIPGSTAGGGTLDGSGQAVTGGAEVLVQFTYQAGASTRGPVRNPYVAVWVEDGQGALVDTIGLWFEQSSKGQRWLDDLRQWYAASGQGADITMSGATRASGSYIVAWDGTDLNGNAVPAGDYIVYIEAAREHGPYSITNTTIAVGDTAAAATFDDSGEIVAASAEFVPGADQ